MRARPWVLLAGLAGSGLPGCARLPAATGETSEVVLICDAPAPHAVAALQVLLASPAPDLVPAEPRFRVVALEAPRTASPPREKNVVIVGRSDPAGAFVRALRRWLPPADGARVDAGGSTWSVLRDVWARGQEVNLLVAPAAALDSLLLHCGPELARHLEESSLARACTTAGAYCVTPAARALQQRHAFVIAVPPAYDVIDRTPDVAAVELAAATPTRSITVFWRDGVQGPESVSEAELLELQSDMLARLHGDSLSPGTSRLQRPAWAPGRRVLRSAWENHTEIAGGPLVTHFVYDASRQRLYGVQGQLFAPGLRKRAAMLELEALLLTFKPAAVR